MIARVAISPGLVASLTPAERPPDLAEFMDLHIRLTDLLLAHGKCVYSSRADEKAMRNALHRLSAVSPDAGKRWATVLAVLQRANRVSALNPVATPPLDAVATLSDLAPWVNRVAVAAVSGVQAAALGVDSAAASRVDPGTRIEVVKGRLLGRSERIHRYERLARGNVVAHGSARDAFFDEALAALVRESRTIQVCDRYLFNVLHRRQNGTTSPPEHVGWLLDRIASSSASPTKTVRLYGGADPTDGPAGTTEAAELVRTHWGAPRGAIKAVEIAAVPWRVAGKPLPHDRHVHFDVEATIEFTAGLDRLARATVRDPDGVRWMYNTLASPAYKKNRVERERIRRAAAGDVVKL